MSSEVESSVLLGSRWLETFAADTVPQNYSRHISGALHAMVMPARASKPRMLLVSPSVASDLGFAPAYCQSDTFLQCMAGNALLPGSRPYATRYGGHQFGQWAGQLGDGRAINLGEVTTAHAGLQCLQLKGAGPTPFSRGADGRAVLRSSVREFLCSEAMHHLGIPSTRALSLVETGDSVVRDMFYDGNAKEEPGAIVCRVAPSFTRFGHFQLCAMKGELALLQQLIDFTIAQDFPDLFGRHAAGILSRDELYCSWFSEVCQLTLGMLLGWMRTGFVHGVLNTDNMSILGLTIDYGPYGWLDNFDPHWTPNTTDAGMHRYAFDQQPAIVQWNLYQLANSLLPAMGNRAFLEEALARFASEYDRQWRSMMLAKIGLPSLSAEEDDVLIAGLTQLLAELQMDMTLFFRRLADFDPCGSDRTLADTVQDALYSPEGSNQETRCRIDAWAVHYGGRVKLQAPDWHARRARMNAVNPCFILRNYLTQLAIDKLGEEDVSLLQELHEALQQPYQEIPRFAHLYQKRPEWARDKAGCSMLSCSS